MWRTKNNTGMLRKYKLFRKLRTSSILRGCTVGPITTYKLIFMVVVNRIYLRSNQRMTLLTFGLVLRMSLKVISRVCSLSYYPLYIEYHMICRVWTYNEDEKNNYSYIMSHGYLTLHNVTIRAWKTNGQATLQKKYETELTDKIY